jgi:hypothetical protein
MANHPNRLLLTLASLTHGDPTDGVNLDMLSLYAKMPHLGIALNTATILEGRGYAVVKRSTRLEENRLQITPTGVAEAARLRLPFWRRWMTDRDVVGKLTVAAAGSILAAAVTGCLRLLGH